MTPSFPAPTFDIGPETRLPAGLDARVAHLFDLQDQSLTNRGEVEDFIRDCFAQMHGARIRHFMPRLLSLRAPRGERIAAFGLREATDSRLFLESYLDRPVEEALRSRLGREVRRDEIVEVGNLSARYPGAARWLIVALTAFLHEQGYRWVVFTGTAALRNGFHRLGLRPVELGLATAAHLPQSERPDWGRYYDGKPVVMAGDIAQGHRSLLTQHQLRDLLRAGIAPVRGVGAA